jgi:phosphatidylserine/phosphatidylglycerophosphate/cardiolipin synthase-like enzyme
MSGITSSPTPSPATTDHYAPVDPSTIEKLDTPGEVKFAEKSAADIARLAREAAAEAGVDAVEMKGSREEILARLAQFQWQPSAADVEKMHAAIENAKAENLTQNETVTGSVYFTKPAVDIKTAANTEMYGALINEIRSANKIHAALYGIDSVPELVDELRAAKARGAEIEIVVDQNPDGTFTYPQTEALLKEFGADHFRVEANSKYAIMHDKFWVFDDKKVWTGSTNINKSAVGKGYNNEISVLVESGNLAKAFEAEHAQMWAGNFHKKKVNAAPENLPTTSDGVSAQVFFSPTDKAIEDGIIPLIKDAKESIHLSLFHFSDANIAKEILDAKARGVDVKLIIDATGAANKATHANVELLRAAGIPVKVENWGGKQHMKGGVVDGKSAVIGSMNWTASGEQKNDENCLVIRNHPVLGGKMEDQFKTSFESLPDLTLFGYFSAEGLNSIGSMVDGSDNDHFGGKDANLSWNNYTKANTEIDTAANKMAEAQGPDAALKAKVQALAILRGEVDKAKAKLTESQGTKADLIIKRIDDDLNDKIGKPRL